MHKALKIGCLGLLCVAALVMLVGMLLGGLLFNVRSVDMKTERTHTTLHRQDETHGRLTYQDASGRRFEAREDEKGRLHTMPLSLSKEENAMTASASVFFLFIAMIVAGFLALVGVLIYLAVGSRGSRKTTDADEARMIQEMYAGLQAMESRIESLETILLEDGHLKETDHDASN